MRHHTSDDRSVFTLIAGGDLGVVEGYTVRALTTNQGVPGSVTVNVSFPDYGRANHLFAIATVDITVFESMSTAGAYTSPPFRST